MNVLAQDNSPMKTVKKKKEPRVRSGQSPAIYITTSTGINNNTAILGFSFDVAVSKNISIDGGPGTGTWGDKVFTGIKYYLKPDHRGFAIGTGLTYAPGVRHRWYNVKSIYGYTESAEFNKNPQTNLFFAAYKFWNLGKKYNRLYAELGWSAPLSSGDKFTQLQGYPISDKDANSLNATAPGGPILAVGISFGVN